ncbi:TrbI/VirB10 family protein [Stenotrophomonas sp. 278]|uniref:TrbI/VirB10 family protein n=1 Tax=Stenotrophomonas sp. 278 TaxID=2479851 RepID=UPI000F67C755|nr:TrbI/VirB10 family protein [Stenotrophomonas sp. 278]RRT99427.1 TrbI/VirB10 family protein [Stenotrophomonas sp. 278]
MTQHNTPGNDPNDNRDDGQGQYGHDNVDPSNPYFGNTQAQAAPNLDAAAPQLRSAEEQRLNRKALAFLGGILVLLVAMGFLLFRKGSSDDEVKKQAETTRASAPEMPRLGPDTSAMVPPVPTEEAQPIPMLPPLPEREPERVSAFNTREPAEREVDRGPSLLDRRIGGGGGVGGGDGNGASNPNDEYSKMMMAAIQASNGGAPAAPAKVQRGPDVEDVSNASFIRSPDALLVRGTYLRCILETRIITDYAGYTSCLLTEPVYSINGRTLLLPKGSKIYGSYGGGPVGDRVEVIWDRITTPNGIDVAMSSPGIDGLGGAGLPGQYSAHWGKRIASALMISLLADAFKYAAAEHGPESTTVTNSGLAIQSPYESATARQMERLAGEALSNRPRPTVTINQGTRINVYVAKDVDFTQVLGRR